jgi:hypothetical protein
LVVMKRGTATVSPRELSSAVESDVDATRAEKASSRAGL